MLQGFKQFLLRGNIVELAVAFVIGLAFAAVVTAFVEDLITPIIAALGGQPDFSSLDFTVNESTFRYGHFLNAVVSFVVIAAAIYFLVVRLLDTLAAKRRAKEDPTTKSCPECLSEIPYGARRCAFCASEVAASA